MWSPSPGGRQTIAAPADWPYRHAVKTRHNDSPFHNHRLAQRSLSFPAAGGAAVVDVVDDQQHVVRRAQAVIVTVWSANASQALSELASFTLTVAVLVTAPDRVRRSPMPRPLAVERLEGRDLFAPMIDVGVHELCPTHRIRPSPFR